MSTHLIGDPDMVTRGSGSCRRTGADEIMLSTRSHSYETRVRSLSLIARSWGLVTSAPKRRQPSGRRLWQGVGPAGQTVNAQAALRSICRGTRNGSGQAGGGRCAGGYGMWTARSQCSFEV